MLLAGGRGSRLNILAAHRAKPAVPFGGLYRIIDFALSNVMRSKLRHVGVLTQYRPASLMNHLADGSSWDLGGHTAKLKILPPFQGRQDFDWYTGTADAVYQNLALLRRYRPQRVLILSGDHIYRMNYREMLDFHDEKGAVATLAAMPVPWEETHRFGILVPDGEGRLVRFQEKPRGQAFSNLASMGIYVFDTEVLVEELIRTHRTGGNDFGAHLIPGLLGLTDRIFVHRFEGYWKDVGTLDSYWQANMDLLDPAAGVDLPSWKIRTNMDYESLHAMPPSWIARGSELERAVVSPGCRIQGRVVRSVLSPGVVVEPGAVVEDSVVMHRSVIAAGARVLRAVVDKHVRVGAGATVGSAAGEAPANHETPDHLSTGITVVGKHVEIAAGAVLGANVIVHPRVVVPAGAVPDGATLKG
ncbi:MAG: glucose-1-phosphate adenylyltransferase [Deltaproteobacteria bacterium]|nr:glucose-1-phosphate adenylyltransferase [Deltaproteobacteria bacterium]